MKDIYKEGTFTFTYRINGRSSEVELKHGEEWEWESGGPTDEGWESIRTTFRLSDCGKFLYRESVNQAQDCDGRHGSHAEHVAFTNVTPLKWERISDRQYDQFAELMNY